MPPMWYDLVILAILAWATIRGAVKGFVWQLATIAAIVLCFAFSETVSLAVAPYIGVKPPLNRWVSMFVLYVVCSFAAFAAARKLRGWLEKARFVEYDRHLGAIFGFLKGTVFCLVLTFFVVTLSEEAKSHVLASRSGHVSAIVMDRLHPVMPAELRDVLEPYIHQLDQPGQDLHAHEVGSHAAAGEDQPNEHPHDHSHPFGNEPAPATGVDHLTAPVGGDPFAGNGTGTGTVVERRQLLQEIAKLFSDYPDAQSAIVEEVDLALAGIPDHVHLAVLKDWHADLMAADDPDPETKLTTSLDVRIVRQLAAAKVPLTTLGDALQDRLRDATR
jgi:membrane protein required for colicin V production